MQLNTKQLVNCRLCRSSCVLQQHLVTLLHCVKLLQPSECFGSKVYEGKGGGGGVTDASVGLTLTVSFRV